MRQRNTKPSYISSRPSTSNTNPSIRDEIEALNAQKSQLLRKKDNLERRIEALQRTCFYSPSQPLYSAELDNEYQSLCQLIEQQKQEISRLKQTDEAALRQELQEEVRTTYLERCRLQELLLQQQRDYNDLREKYQEMIQNEGPDAIERMKAKIAKYEDCLSKYKHSNHKIKAKIETMKANKFYSDEEGQKKVEQRRVELNSEIEKMKSEIDEIERKIEDEKEDHRQKLRDIRLSRASQK